MCGAEQDQGLSLQPCWVCRGLGWAQRAWLAVGHLTTLTLFLVSSQALGQAKVG